MTAVDRSVAGLHPFDRRHAARRIRRILAVTGLFDCLILVFAVGVAWKARNIFGAFSQGGAGAYAVPAAPWIVVVWLVVLFLQGGYSNRNFAAGPDEYRVVGTASFVTAGVVGFGCYLLKVDLSRGFVLLVFVIGLPLLLLGRLIIRHSAYSLRRTGHLLHRVIAVGSPSGVEEVCDALTRDRYIGYRVIGACVPPGTPGAEAELLSVPVLPRPPDMRTLCDEKGADTVLIARGGYSSSQELRRIAWELEGTSIDLVVVPSLTDVAGPRIHIRPVAGLPLLHVEQPQADEAAGFEKRLFDIAGAGLALLMLSPIMLVVALLIWLEDRGPIFFRQPRVGRDGVAFGCYKFRSMFVNADALEQKLREDSGHEGALFKLERDPRITRIGSFIRRYSIDELPQLLNVVRGDMSLVGPRPQQAWEVETYTDWEGRRLRVRPGMTGLWQVSGRSQLSFDEAIRLDLYYVDNWSMTGDLVIMAKTVRAVFGTAGAY